jgi:hypothetical protein
MESLESERCAASVLRDLLHLSCRDAADLSVQQRCSRDAADLSDSREMQRISAKCLAAEMYRLQTKSRSFLFLFFTQIELLNFCSAVVERVSE